MDIKELRKQVTHEIGKRRMTGNTTALANAAIASGAFLVVANYQQRINVIKRFPELNGRVFSLSRLEVEMRGVKAAPILFDNEVIHQLCSEPKQEEMVENADGSISYLINSFINQEDIKNLTGKISKEPVKQQLNVKLTETDVQELAEINDSFFEGEATNSMIGRLVLRKGIAAYKKLKEIL